jgi:hypothetical protein
MPAWRPPRSRTGQSRHPPIQELFSRLARASALSQPKPSVGSLASLSFYPLARASSRYSPMCKTALALRFNGRKRHAICSRRGGRLVQRTAGRRRSRRDSRLIVKTSPRFTVNWPALASSILEDSGPVFTNRRCGAISPVRSVPDPPASTAPRAREGIKTHALLSRRRSSTIHGAHPIPKLR